MDSIKTDVCNCLNLQNNRLHEIALEDIQLTPPIQKNIYKTIANLFAADVPTATDPAALMLPMGDITCKGYWVENTKELVLYVWLGEQSKAIVVPKSGWFLRTDIIVH